MLRSRSRGGVDRAWRDRLRTPRSRAAERLGRQISPTRGSRGRRGGRRRGEAALARPGGQRRAQRLHPLTNLCRDRCTYCTFAKRPGDPGAKSYTLAEVAEVSRHAARAAAPRRSSVWATSRSWCSTATAIGSPRRAIRARPRISSTRVAWRSRKHAPAHQRGAAHAAADGRAAAVERVDGLMLETTSERLCEKGGAHHAAPDKKPALRLRMHAKPASCASRSRPGC